MHYCFLIVFFNSSKSDAQRASLLGTSGGLSVYTLPANVGLGLRICSADPRQQLCISNSQSLAACTEGLGWALLLLDAWRRWRLPGEHQHTSRQDSARLQPIERTRWPERQQSQHQGRVAFPALLLFHSSRLTHSALHKVELRFNLNEADWIPEDVKDRLREQRFCRPLPFSLKSPD
jgi:hypothetical protein